MAKAKLIRNVTLAEAAQLPALDLSHHLHLLPYDSKLYTPTGAIAATPSSAAAASVVVGGGAGSGETGNGNGWGHAAAGAAAGAAPGAGTGNGGGARPAADAAPGAASVGAAPGAAAVANGGGGCSPSDAARHPKQEQPPAVGLLRGPGWKEQRGKKLADGVEALIGAVYLTAAAGEAVAAAGRGGDVAAAAGEEGRGRGREGEIARADGSTGGLSGAVSGGLPVSQAGLAAAAAFCEAAGLLPKGKGR